MASDLKNSIWHAAWRLQDTLCFVHVFETLVSDRSDIARCVYDEVDTLVFWKVEDVVWDPVCINVENMIKTMLDNK